MFITKTKGLHDLSIVQNIPAALIQKNNQNFPAALIQK